MTKMIRRYNRPALIAALLAAGLALLLFAGCTVISNPLAPEPDPEPPPANTNPADTADPANAAPATSPASGSAPAAPANPGDPPSAPPSGAAGPATPEVVVAGGRSIKQWSAPPPLVIDASASYTAVLATSAGAITVELFAEEAPNTVNNFVFLAREGFYDNVIFHRTIPGFMIQGGDPTGTGGGGPGYRFADEPVRRPYSRGVMAMANAGPNTNGSQFFLMHADYALPPNYTILGQAVAGLETIDAIATAPTRPGGEGSAPVTPAVIESVEIIGP